VFASKSRQSPFHSILVIRCRRSNGRDYSSFLPGRAICRWVLSCRKRATYPWKPRWSPKRALFQARMRDGRKGDNRTRSPRSL
jgi:hypothetical protein